jgi:serine/threonine protein kinase
MTSISSEQAGEYRLLGELGRGAFGEVFQAQHKGSKEMFALKLIRCQRLEQIGQAFQEVILPTKAKAGNIIRVHHYFLKEAPDPRCKYQLGIIMELGACSLDDFIARARVARTRISSRHLEHLVYSLVETLAALEAEKLYHRDIKPGNVILCGEHGLDPKLADFGISTLLEHEFDSRKAGSLDYAAPRLRPLLENPKKKGVYSVPKSDVYSLGMTILEVASMA